MERVDSITASSTPCSRNQVQEFADVSPVHADEVNRAVAAGADQSPAHGPEKIGELIRAHVAPREIAVLFLGQS